MHKLLFFTILLFASFLSFAQTFGGKVVDKAGTAILNVEVYFTHESESVYTDEDGNWSFESQEPEAQTLVFYRDGFAYEQLVNQEPDTEIEMVLRESIPSAATLREQEYVVNGCESVHIPDNSEWNVGFKISELKGDLAPDKNYTRRDPSAVISVNGKYYVWYSFSHTFETQKIAPWDLNDIYFASSDDGIFWKEHGPAVKRGKEGEFDHRSVFTTEIFAHEGKYYLVYQAAKDEDGIYNRNTVGMSVADSPEGPWRKLKDPILHPTYTKHLFFDNNAVHDPCLVFYNNKFYLYYKGECNCFENGDCQRWCNPVCGLQKQVKWGVAIAEHPEGPYLKSEYNPVTNTGHEVMVWPYKNGIAILQHQDGPEANSIQFAEDGVNFVPQGKVSNIPEAAGLFRTEKSENYPHAGIQWGMGHKLMWNAGPNGWMYIYRFDILDTKASGLNIIPDKIELGVGQKRNVSIKLKPHDASFDGLTWISKNENIAKVDGSGLMGVSEGTTSIYLKSRDEKLQDSCTVNVIKEHFKVNAINVAANSFIQTGGTYNDASSGGPGYGVKRNGAGINFVNKNDWCTFQVEVAETGVYELEYEISTPMENPEISFEMDEIKLAQDEVFTNGAWDSYYRLKSESLISFKNTGLQEIKIIASGTDNWQWNLKSFSFTRLYDFDLLSNTKTYFKNLNIFSIPFEKKISIKGINREFSVSVYSVLGQKCFAANFFGETIIHLDSSFSGIYLVQIMQDRNIFNTKVLL